MKHLVYQQTIYPFQIDFVRHVSNIVYIQWMEIGRCQLMDQLGFSIHCIAEEGFVPVITETKIEYKKPLLLGDAVTVRLHISELAKASARLHFVFQNQHGHTAAIGQQRGLFVDFETGRPKRLTADQRAKFEEYTIDETSDGAKSTSSQHKHS